MIASKIKKPSLAPLSIITQYPVFSAFFLGLVLAFAFAPFYFWPLVFIIYALLYKITCSIQSKKKSAQVGIAFYLAIIISQFHWGYDLASNFWQQSFTEAWQIMAISLFSMFIFFVGTCIIYAFGFAVLHWFLQSPQKSSHPIYFAGTLVMLEHLQGFPFHGKFNWMQTGYAFADQAYLSQLASLNTVSVISFVAIMVAVMIAQIKNRYYLPPIFIIISLWLGYGAYHLHFAKHLISEKEVHIRVVAGNFDPQMGQSEQGKRKTFLSLLNLSQDNTQEKEQKADLIIWPESGIPFIYNEEPAIQDRLKQELSAPLISGSYIRKDDKIYNVALYLNEHGDLIHYVSKKFLVPFGEYWPFGGFLPSIQHKLEQRRPFLSRDDIPPIIAIKDIGNILIFNCYDILFQSDFKTYAEDSDFMIHLTSEAWFSHSIQAREQIFAFTRMRALENRQYLIRVSDGGVNAVINPLGQVRHPIYDDLPIQHNIHLKY